MTRFDQILKINFLFQLLIVGKHKLNLQMQCFMQCITHKRKLYKMHMHTSHHYQFEKKYVSRLLYYYYYYAQQVWALTDGVSAGKTTIELAKKTCYSKKKKKKKRFAFEVVVVQVKKTLISVMWGIKGSLFSSVCTLKGLRHLLLLLCSKDSLGLLGCRVVTDDDQPAGSSQTLGTLGIYARV